MRNLLPSKGEALDARWQGDDIGAAAFLFQQGLFAKVVAVLQHPNFLLFQLACLFGDGDWK